MYGCAGRGENEKRANGHPDTPLIGEREEREKRGREVVSMCLFTPLPMRLQGR
jgi:hypothetical protein